MRRPCPGSASIGLIDNKADWCPVCGRPYRVRNDGTIRRHPMDYARIVAYASHVVRDVEIRTGWWLPA